MYTSRWGTVSPGIVLAAIAAALEPQQVPVYLIVEEPLQVNDTLKLEMFEQYRQLSSEAVLDNLWAATLAGYFFFYNLKIHAGF